ncbi:glucuronide transporter [Promicromonospora soli]|uniref:Glucuronide transporter n=1 Tax=Promicromonospora soli TaxID=2035533 RepID=A0A919L107_9MICO|nr:glucuronide transporter [Promicromonospora soli]GHH79494.1 glucuronide transporter [Promicromonospora soli]
MSTSAPPTPTSSNPASSAPDRLSAKAILGYGAGDFANNLAFATAGAFLLIYYTDVAGISAAAAGTLLLVVRIFDAFADILAGRIVDRTYSKRLGKFRPFLLFGSVPLLGLSVATFAVPQIGHTGMLVYAYLTYAALGLAYSLVNIPYGSLAGAMTQVPSERAKLASARSVGGSIVSAGLGILIAPRLVPGADLQTVFTVATLCFMVVGTACYLFTFFTCRERVQREVTHVSMRQSFTTLKGNRPLLMLCVSSVLFITGGLSLSTLQLYYVRDVLHALHLYPVLSTIQLVATFVLAPAIPFLVRRFGKRTAYMGGSVVTALGGLIVALSPTNVILLPFAGLVLGMFGFLLVNMLVWALEADTVEYGEWRTGVRTEGITYALFSFTRKTGQAIGGAVGAYALALGGYAAGAPEQTEAALWGIRIGTGIVPALCALAAALIMLAYPLTDTRHAEIVAEIAARRQQGGGDNGPDGQRSASPAPSDPASSVLD